MAHDSDMSELSNYAMHGWPVVSAITPALKPFYEVPVRNMLSIQNYCIVVLPVQHAEILAVSLNLTKGFKSALTMPHVAFGGQEFMTLCETCERCKANRPAQHSKPIKPTIKLYLTSVGEVWC